MFKNVYSLYSAFYPSLRFTPLLLLLFILPLVRSLRAVCSPQSAFYTDRKLQCLYENLMSNNFHKTAILKKI